MKRLAALLGAVLLIAVAVVIRDQLDDRDSGATSSGPDERSAEMTLVCVEELAEVCEELQRQNGELSVRIENAGATLDALGAADADPAGEGVDGWLTFSPLPEMVDEQRQREVRQSTLGDRTGALARSPMVIAIWNDRRDVLARQCGEINWRCIGDVAGRPWIDVGGDERWGAVEPSHPQPVATAEGLLAMTGAVNSWFGNTGYALQDLRAGDFPAWFERLERAVPEFPRPPRTPLDSMLEIGPATFDLTGTTEAAAAPTILGSRVSGQLAIIYPSPVVVAEVVLVSISGADAGGRVRELLESDEAAEAFSRHGWRVDDRPLADGLSTTFVLPDGTGLPRPGVLEALRLLWADLRL